MKRILIFSLSYYPRFIGGDAVAIKEITDRISSSDVEFHLVTLRFDSMLPKEEKIGNVFVHRIGFALQNPSASDLKRFPLHYTKALYQVSAALKGALLHRRYKFDALWAVMAHSAGVPAALFKLFYPRIPYVLTLQEGDPPEYIERVMRPFWPLFTRAFTEANFVQTISTFLAKWARRRGFKGPLEVVPNGVDVELFTRAYPSQELELLKQTLSKNESDIYLITTSRLVYKNGLDNVLRALALLPLNIHFLILGIGPDEEKLKDCAKKLKIADRVKFLGQVNHKDMPKYLRVSDIFIRPSRSEGMGNSFVEAMAAGIPVIGTMVGGITDFLKDRETGFVCGVEDPKSIVSQVKFILNPENEQAVKSVIRNAKNLAEKDYNWEKISANMRAIFQKVLWSR